MKHTPGKYVLGVDGGGTKTSCVIINENGKVVFRGKAGPSNHLVVGIRKAKNEIAKAIKTALKKSEVNQISVACLGLAGIGLITPDLKVCKTFRKFVKKYFPIKKVIIESDVSIAAKGALVDDFGVVVIAGTGSIAFGINKKGERKRAGGYGFLFGDEGSAYDIGRKGIIAALKALDGVGKRTLLLPKLKDFSQITMSFNIENILRELYAEKAERDQIASFAPQVVEAARGGDNVAINILKEAGSELGSIACAVIKDLNMEKDRFEVALVGGVFQAGDLISKFFESKVKKCAPKVKIVRPKFEPVIGAALIALREAGASLNHKLLSSIQRSLNK